jgi:hypothetical protein
MDGARIVDGTITTRQIKNADGSTITTVGNGIVGSQIRLGTITANNIMDGTISAGKLAQGVGAVPKDAILMFMSQEGTNDGCPDGFEYVTDFEGRFPLGRNTDAGSNINRAGIKRGAKIVGTTANGDNDATISSSPHAHGIGEGGGNRDVGGGGTTCSHYSHNHGGATGGATTPIQVPYMTVIFCKKL